MREID